MDNRTSFEKMPVGKHGSVIFVWTLLLRKDLMCFAYHYGLSSDHCRSRKSVSATEKLAIHPSFIIPYSSNLSPDKKV